MEFSKFVDDHVAVVAPLEKGSSLAYWKAATTGSDEDYKRYSELTLEFEKIYTDREDFEYVKSIRESGEFGDGRLARTADLLYLRYKGNQIDPLLLGKIVELGTLVENRFTVFRAEVDGKRYTTNDVYHVLREETDSGMRRKVWEASKGVGRIVLTDLMELVRLRNEAARKNGFDNYYTMSMILSEQNEEELESVFAELEELTREPYLELKNQLDASLAKRYGIKPEEIRPWHYHDPYFQEAPQTDGIDFDGYYRGKDPVVIARGFYESIGMTVGDILERSDLYEREGKNPHAFCTDIDREGDIRILANMKNDNYWMETILHELGHGVYDKYIDSELPFLLRQYPHLCSTEASAMYFGRLAQDPVWIKHALGLDESEMRRFAPRIRKHLRMKQLIFTRWCQTMFHFERALYKDPDRDLDTLWWDIVEKYQYVSRPEGRNEPDWATKIHIVTSPVYYHNYMLGELIASQFHYHIMSEILGGDVDEVDLYGRKEVGRYFTDVVYGPGNTTPWGEHVELVTGEPLTARHFVAQFIKESD